MVKTFWRGVFSEEDGSPSLSRIATAVIVVDVLTILDYYVFKKLMFPDSSVLLGLSGLCTALYAANKVSEKASDMIGALKGVPTGTLPATMNPASMVGAAVAKVGIAAPTPPDSLIRS